MDALKRKLTEYNIDYVEKVFATSESINALQPNPFVSALVYLCIMCVHIIAITSLQYWILLLAHTSPPI